MMTQVYKILNKTVADTLLELDTKKIKWQMEGTNIFVEKEYSETLKKIWEKNLRKNTKGK